MLQSVSVITNFVIPKRDKKNKNITQTKPLPVPNFTFIGARCRLCGAKNQPYIHILFLNNTGMAAPRAGLPVII